jgi:hypothetical protein
LVAALLLSLAKTLSKGRSLVDLQAASPVDYFLVVALAVLVRVPVLMQAKQRAS